MIQRIQTVYLLFAALFAGLMLWLPLGYFLGDEQEFKLMAFGLQNIADESGYFVNTFILGSLVVITAVLPLVTIFLFKNRLLQIRLCFMEIVLLFGVLVFTALYLYRGWKAIQIFDSNSMAFAVAAIFPLVSAILTYMAFRGIAKDEALVRSVNRIR